MKKYKSHTIEELIDQKVFSNSNIDIFLLILNLIFIKILQFSW